MSNKLSLEEIRKLDDQLLGKRLAKACGATLEKHRNGTWFYSGETFGYQPCVNICKSLDSVAQIEKLVIEQTSFTDYGRCLVGVTEFHGIGLDSLARIATASARQRAEAALLALQDG